MRRIVSRSVMNETSSRRPPLQAGQASALIPNTRFNVSGQSRTSAGSPQLGARRGDNEIRPERVISEESLPDLRRSPELTRVRSRELTHLRRRGAAIEAVGVRQVAHL